LPTFYPSDNKMDYKVHRCEDLYLIHDYSNENALTVLTVIRRYIQTYYHDLLFPFKIRQIG